MRSQNLPDHLIEFFSKIAKNDFQIANIELEDKPFCEVKALYDTILCTKTEDNRPIGCYVIILQHVFRCFELCELST